MKSLSNATLVNYFFTAGGRQSAACFSHLVKTWPENDCLNSQNM